MTITYFLTIVYCITSIAIIIEWCRSPNLNNSDIMINLNYDRGKHII
jgi:hypothetical protein